MASGANTMPVIKTGTGTLTLTGANSFSGGLTVNAGTLFARTSGSVLGGSGAGVVKLGDTSGSANVTLLVGSSLNLTNPITVLSGSSGTVTINNYANYSPIFAGAITLNKNLTVYNGNASGVRAITIGGNISGGGGLQITAANIADPIILSGSNSFSGGVMLYSGNLIINSTNAFGATASILSIWGGELDNTNAAVITIANNNPQNWNADFTFVGTQNLNLGNGNVTLGGNRQVTVVSNTLTVGGAISGLGYALTKTGAGTLSLTGANTFSGNTTISSGTLALGATGSIISTPLITIGSGATFDVSAPGAFQLNGSTTLAGNGTVNGSVTEQAGGVIFPGGSGQAGTLTLNNNLTLNQGGNLYYNLTNSTGGPNSTLTVGGSINCSGTNVSTFYPIAGDFASGTYVLMNYGNTLIGGATNFAISLANTQSRRTFLFNTSTYGEVKLVVGGSPLANLVWTGDGVANAWNYNSAANWTNGSSRDVFKQLDAVVFDDTGSASPVVSLVGALYPQSITFSNQSKSYTFGGSGSLNGVGGLSLQSGGTVTLANTGGNTFSGAIIINSGELILADPNAIGQASSARLVAGTGILGLSGGYVFSSIPLQLVGSASAGDNLVNISGTNVWTGSCTLNSGGANYGIRSDDGQLILTGNIAPISSLTGTRTLALGGGGNGIISGVIANGIACTTALNLAGTGEWILSGTNTYTGSTSINSGILAVNGVLQGGTVFLYGGILGGTGVINGPVTPIFGGTLAPAAYSNKTSKLTVNNTLTTPPTTVMQIARTGTVVTNDSVVGISALTYGGTLNIITNASSGILHVGDTFKLFSASNYIGTFNTINYPDGYTFTNRLAVDGTLTVLTAPVTIPTASTNIMYFISGNSLHLSWPASYLGWSLQVQTNSLGTGLSTNWMTISGAELVTSTNIPISAKNGSVFYRMKYMP